jgi:ATP-dependent DNA helicase PIF1
VRQSQALQVMLSGESVFLTGAPGAGKTYVLNQFIARAKAKGQQVAVTASTGIAATHIGGTTIHSWSGLGIKDRLTDYDRTWLKGNDRLKKRYNAVDTLVIDEISMLHGARLDMVNEACKLLRQSEKPFGGLQVILVGDLFQLPPVNRASELTDFAHTSAAWAELDPKICYISEQHRQQGDALLELLEAMRSGELDTMHFEALESRKGQTPPVDAPVTKLYTHNIDVESINQRHLESLFTDSQTFKMATTGQAAKVEQLLKSILAPEELELKIGAEVMFVANNFAAGFVNGTRGQVVAFKEKLPYIKLANDRVVRVEPHTWTLMEDNRKRAEVMQLPLRLAWAITIHKSQGMSLDAAEIDLSKSFTPGMGYVALSRVRSLDGIYLTGINQQALQLHPAIFEFDRELQRASAIVAETALDAPELAEEPITSSENAEVTYDKELFELLKAWRIDRARRDKVAPFMVAHNTTLEALAARPPQTSQQLMGTKGFGPAKHAAYGAEILAVTVPYMAAKASVAPSIAEPLEVPEAAQVQATGSRDNIQANDQLEVEQQITEVSPVNQSDADAEFDALIAMGPQDEGMEADEFAPEASEKPAVVPTASTEQQIATLDAKHQKVDALKAEYPRTGKRWTPEEESQLLEAFQAQMPLQKVCEALGRTPGSVWAHLPQLLDAQK